MDNEILEKNLRRDYITLMSRYVVREEVSRIYDDITALAEMGQEDACAWWYKLAGNQENNCLIDENVNKMSIFSSKELLAKAYYDYHKNDRKGQLAKIKKGNSVYASDEEEAMAKVLSEDLGKSDFFKYYKKAIDKCYVDYHFSQDPVYYERYHELLSGMTSLQRELYDIHTFGQVLELKRLRSALLALHIKDKENDEISFALGKNLTFFKVAKKKSTMGYDILTRLANRELSSQLVDYKANKFCEKQIDV